MSENYQNVELSFPRFETERLRFLTFFSEALGRRDDVTLFLPPRKVNRKDLPLVILLHGVYGSHWSWAFCGGAHRTALEMIEAGEIRPMVLAMPSDGMFGQGSGYLPLPGGNYEEWIMRDVNGCVRQRVPYLSAQSPLFLSGLSMGGYGALRLGAKYADEVKGVSAHSSVTHGLQLAKHIQHAPQLPPDAREEEWKVLYWMEKHRDRLPPIRFDCGLDDTLLLVNRKLHRQMTQLGIPHTYEEFPGAHTWAYWEQHLRDTLRFFNGLL